MRCRTYKGNIIPMPMRPSVPRSCAWIFGGTAMMVFAEVPGIIIATSLLLFLLWRKPSGIRLSASGHASREAPPRSGQGSTDRACAQKKYKPLRQLCSPPRRRMRLFSRAN